jgi:GT2 family glycosyltransferase
MKLLVVIVNFRTPCLVIDCLASLEAEIAAIPGARVVVVDNASGDDSAEKIEVAIRSRNWGAWASLLRAERNGGFAYGNNLAIRPAMSGDDPPEFVHLLNPDTVVIPGAIRSLLAFLEENPTAGIAGSRLEAEDGRMHPNGFRFYSILSEFEHAVSLRIVSRLLQRWSISIPLSGDEQQVDWVCGASMMIRKAVLESAGYFDERYFLYYEEADFCLQAYRAGWACWYIPKSRVIHVLSAATQALSGTKRRPPYWFESRRHYLVKNHGSLYTFVASLTWTLGYAFWTLRRRVQKNPAQSTPYMLGDFLRYSFFDRKPPAAAGND